jgi:YfiH family protein
VTAASLLEFAWQLPPGVRAAFTTRRGGVSLPPWDSFNLAMHVNDAPAHVAANRARLRELLGLQAEPAWLDQVHGVAVSDLDGVAPTAPTAPTAATAPISADASIASRAGSACVVMVADCLPVLFTTRNGEKFGAAHAGWRGLASGVLEATVRALRVPGSDLMAWLGPCISRENFEVGEEVREEFVRQDPCASAYFDRNARGRWQADLVGLAKRRLSQLGVTDVAGGHWCTYADRERFYSHRRDGKGGRMAALIWREIGAH